MSYESGCTIIGSVPAEVGFDVNQIRSNLREIRHGDLPPVVKSRNIRKFYADLRHAQRCTYCMVQIEGQAMEPRYPDGCVVGVNLSDTRLVPGALYAVEMPWGELALRNAFNTIGEIVFRALNPEYPEHSFPAAEALGMIRGRVTWTMRLLTEDPMWWRENQ